MMWRLSPDSFREYIKSGHAKFGQRSKKTGQRAVYYLQAGIRRMLETGEVVVTGKDDEGALEIAFADTFGTRNPATVWDMVSHSASEHGAGLLKLVIPGRRFPYPKSVYAVEDCLRFYFSRNKEGIVLDFFAGSGTTAHAVMRLNRQDGGSRQCISVTNNEVAADEQDDLRQQGLSPGDPDWEKWGICNYITWPRLVAAITGKTPDGQPIQGDYKFTDEFPIADGFPANLAYFKLEFLDKDRVALKRAFREILPLLWLKAGAIGPRPELLPRRDQAEPEPAFFAPPANPFAVLLDEGRLKALLAALAGRSGLKCLFIVTDSEDAFNDLSSDAITALRAESPGLETVQLYRDYLDNFLINADRSGTGEAGGAA
jgi:adenine-specific DNA-methyltransferase